MGVGIEILNNSTRLIARQALHAQKLSFAYEGINHVFQVNMPEDMEELVNKLK